MNINYKNATLGVMSDILEDNPEMTFGELLHHMNRDKFTDGRHSTELSNEDWYNILEIAKDDENLEAEEYFLNWGDFLDLGFVSWAEGVSKDNIKIVKDKEIGHDFYIITDDTKKPIEIFSGLIENKEELNKTLKELKIIK